MNNKEKPLTEEYFFYYLENDNDSDIPHLTDEEDCGWIDDSEKPIENMNAFQKPNKMRNGRNKTNREILFRVQSNNK